MNKFIKGAMAQQNETVTENGMEAYKSTNDFLVDLFGTIGAMRTLDQEKCLEIFEKAYNTDKLIALKCLFYAADIRRGLGERRATSMILRWLANNDPEVMKLNIGLIAEFNRWDLCYAFDGTLIEKEAYDFLLHQFKEDIENAKNNKQVSLLGKWLKSENASRKAMKLARKTYGHFNMTPREYRKALTVLRKKINIVESKLVEKNYTDIDYSKVPAYAMKKYSAAFMRHDTERYQKYLADLKAGKTKVNASVLYPYDIVRSSLKGDALAEEQWKALPNYIDGENNVLVMADTSGSMTWDGGQPIDTAVGLAIYFAEHNVGAFKDLFLTFSTRPAFVSLAKLTTLKAKIGTTMRADWGGSTDIIKAMELILDTAVKANAPQKDMPKSLIIISDMEFDSAVERGFTKFYDITKAKFEDAGYKIPGIVFWNVNSRQEVFHLADTSKKGVQLVSGASASIFKTLLGSLNTTPYEYMMKVLSDPRYDVVKIEA